MTHGKATQNRGRNLSGSSTPTALGGTTKARGLSPYEIGTSLMRAVHALTDAEENPNANEGLKGKVEIMKRLIVRLLEGRRRNRDR